jgi:hypothetical protein
LPDVGDLSHVFSPGSVSWPEFLFQTLVYKSLVVAIGGRIRVDRRFGIVVWHDEDLHNVVAPTYSNPHFSRTTTARSMRLGMNGAGCRYFVPPFRCLNHKNVMQPINGTLIMTGFGLLTAARFGPSAHTDLFLEGIWYVQTI